jgi:CRP-like cAMP-binding protein
MHYMDKAAEMFLFAGADRQVIEGAVQDAGCETVSYTSGENIFDPADFQRKLGLVLEGSVRAYGGQVLLNVISTGGVFGAAALFGSNRSYCSRLKAVGSCKIMFFTEALVQRLISEHAVIAVNYVRFLSDKIRFLNNKIATFTADSARSTLMQYLVSQGEIQNRPDGTVLLPMSCQKLAEFLNMGRASLYRAFEQLESDGLIRRNGKSVEIYTIIEGV